MSKVFGKDLDNEYRRNLGTDKELSSKHARKLFDALLFIQKIDVETYSKRKPGVHLGAGLMASGNKITMHYDDHEQRIRTQQIQRPPASS